MDVKSCVRCSSRLEVLTTNPPYASPLWEEALLSAVSRSPRVEDDFKRQRLLGAMTSGYWMNTSADTTWDAFDALDGYKRGESDAFAFATSRLVRYGDVLRSAGPRPLFALEPLLVDDRLPEASLEKTLLTAVDMTTKAMNYPSFRHPAQALSATIVRTLDARPDLSPAKRTTLLRALGRVLQLEAVATPERRIRQAVVQWVTADRAHATFGSAVPPTTGRREFQRLVDGKVLAFVITSADETTANSTYWVTYLQNIGSPSPSPSDWAGPFALPAL